MVRNFAPALCAALLFASPAFANIVVNGGFETGDFTGWDQVNDTSFSGVTCASFGGLAPPEGSCQAFFGPTDPGGGGILQTFTTIPGGSYELSFQLANLGNPPNAFGLFWDAGFVSIDFDLPPFDYMLATVELTATSSSTTLGFIFFHQPSFFLLDDVVLVAEDLVVPAPASLGVMLAGMGLLGFAARRRRTV